MNTAIAFAIFVPLAILLSSLWLAVAWALMRLLNLRSPAARVFVLLAPLLAAFVSLLRLMPDWRFEILVSCVTAAGSLGVLDFIRYTGFRNRLASERLPYPAADAICWPLSTALGMEPVRVYLSNRLKSGPIVLGLFKPSIVFPSPLASQLDDEEVRVLLAHELAHIHRRDLLLKWVLLFFRRLALWNPVAAWPYQQLSLEIEFACDRIACRLTGKPGTLARTLCKIEALHASAADKGPRLLEVIPRADGSLFARIDYLSAANAYHFEWNNLAKTLIIFSVYWLICFRPAEFIRSLVIS